MVEGDTGAVEGDTVAAGRGDVLAAGGARRRRARKSRGVGEGSGSGAAKGTALVGGPRVRDVVRSAERKAIRAAESHPVTIRRAVVATSGREADAADVLAAVVGEAVAVGGAGTVERDGRRVVAVVRFAEAWREDKWLDRTETLEALLGELIERDDGVKVERAA